MIERKTRIVCTLGPASSSEEMLDELIDAGMNVARLNFSHGDHAGHARVFERVRAASRRAGRMVAVLQDLCGPKIRLGMVDDGVELKSGAHIRITPDDCHGTAERVQVTYDHLANDLNPGDRVLIDDGNLELMVDSLDGREVVAVVIHGGPLRSRKGVNLPGARLSVPALTHKDEVDLRFGLQLGVDLVALSFVRAVSDLDRVRQIMDEMDTFCPVIVKIEKGEVLPDLESVITAADGVMVARGDLGIEVALEDVPFIQKEAIRLAIKHARPVITATQMLESMITNATPTRAEVNDIANAILDGTDAVMLSAETAAGAYPARAVRVMHRVALRTEQELDYKSVLKVVAPFGQSVEAVALAACEIAEEVAASAILACTYNGWTVRRIAKYRPRAPILGVAATEKLARELVLVWGVTPMAIGEYYTTEQLLQQAEAAAVRSGLVSVGQMVVVVAGMPMGSPTNMIMVRQVESEAAMNSQLPPAQRVFTR